MTLTTDFCVLVVGSPDQYRMDGLHESSLPQGAKTTYTSILRGADPIQFHENEIEITNSSPLNSEISRPSLISQSDLILSLSLSNHLYERHLEQTARAAALHQFR